MGCGRKGKLSVRGSRSHFLHTRFLAFQYKEEYLEPFGRVYVHKDTKFKRLPSKSKGYKIIRRNFKRGYKYD